jgi:hypothetical protein
MKNPVPTPFFKMAALLTVSLLAAPVLCLGYLLPGFKVIQNVYDATSIKEAFTADLNMTVKGKEEERYSGVISSRQEKTRSFISRTDTGKAQRRPETGG